MGKPKNILVLTYWSFGDALVQTYTLPYLRIILNILPEGSTIHLMTLEKNEIASEEKMIEKGIYHFSYQLHPFGLKAGFGWMKNISGLKKIVRTKNIDFIHSWCTSAGSIGWWLSKKTGVPLILDSFEPHAEAMVETGTWKRGGIAHRLLFYLERKQTHHAKWLIGVVPAMKDYAAEKYKYTGTNFLFKPACIDLVKFNPSKRKNPGLLAKLNLQNKIVCVYAGKFGGLYLTSEIFDFFKKAHDFWGDKFRALLLTSAKRNEIEKFCNEAGINPGIVISDFVHHSVVPEYLGLADFAFSAIKPVPSRRCCTPIKNGECLAMGLPIIIPKGISVDSEIISNSGTGVILENLTPAEMENGIRKMDFIIAQNSDGKLSQQIYELAVKYRNFTIADDTYRKIYQE